MPRVRCVFSEGERQIRLGNGGPPGPQGKTLPGFRADLDGNSAKSWRALTRVLQSCTVAIRSSAADLLHAALPSDCRVCGSPMLGLRPVRICDVCVDRVRSQADAQEILCSRCGDALGMESARFAASLGAHECTPCRMSPPAFARAVAFGSYDNEMREMLHALKFDGMRRVAEHVLGDWMAEAILKLEGEAAGELLVIPVPLFRDRERGRGFNQSGLLAASAVKRLRKLRPGWKLVLAPDALRRVRDTRPQFALGAAQRQANLNGAFRAERPERLKGREVLLIDDILTSGATANACSRALLRAGAGKVWVATVARAQPESVRAMEASVARWDMSVVERQIPAG